MLQVEPDLTITVPPARPVLPSADSAAPPRKVTGIDSVGPCWLQVEPERTRMVAPPPVSGAVLPSPASASAVPAAAPTRGPCWVHVEPERVKK